MCLLQSACRYIIENLPEQMKPRVQLFNSFFYTKVGAKSPAHSDGSSGSAAKSQRNYDSVKRWTQVRSQDFSKPPSEFFG